MAIYKTKQRDELMLFFEKNPHKIFSTSDIVTYLKNTKNVGVSTIYRNLALLEETGEIKRVDKSSSKEARYRYVGHIECKNHIHLICEKCHESIHLDHEASSFLNDAILKMYNFVLDKNSTIIYGVCKNCK